MAIKTRSMSKARRPTSSAKKSYRKRVRSSACRGIKSTSCANKSGCKMSKGKKRSYCRKTKNARRTRKV